MGGGQGDRGDDDTAADAAAPLLQDASKVVLGNLTSYAGFFTVDAEKASNMFFWFFPAQ